MHSSFQEWFKTNARQEDGLLRGLILSAWPHRIQRFFFESGAAAPGKSPGKLLRYFGIMGSACYRWGAKRQQPGRRQLEMEGRVSTETIGAGNSNHVLFLEK